MNKLITKLTLLLTLTLSSHSSYSSERKNMFNTQAIVSIKISAYLCKFDLKVNDVTVASSIKNFPTEVTVPINQWIKKGINSIRLEQDVSEQKTLDGSTCDVVLLIKQEGADKKTNIPITNLILKEGLNTSQPADKLDADSLKSSNIGTVISNEIIFQESKEQLVLERSVSLPINLPEWKWFSSEKITDTKEMRSSLYAEYEQMDKLLEEKNFSNIGKLMSERLVELGQAFYKSPQEMAELSNLQNDANNLEMELAPLDPDIEIKLMGNNKLIEVTRWNGKPQVGFVYKDRSATVLYSLIYRKSGDKWILTR